MTANLSEAEFLDLLRKEVDQENRHYSHIQGFALRFEADDTRAKDDTASFNTILNLLGAPSAVEAIVQPTDTFPTWDVKLKLNAALASLTALDGRKLMLVHYAGHGMVDHNSNLEFFANPQRMEKTVRFDALSMTVAVTDMEKDVPLDVLFIIDCCYGGVATRHGQPARRIVQVLAAVEGNQTAFEDDQDNPRRTNRTFTSKLADHITRLKGAGVNSIDFGEVIASVAAESPWKQPVHRVLIGPTAIRVRLSTHTSAHSRSSSSSGVGDGYRALLGVHLSDDLTAEKVRDLADWVRALDPVYGITVDGIYKTFSSLVTINVPYRMFVGLEGRPGIELVDAVFGHNVLKEVQ